MNLAPVLAALPAPTMPKVSSSSHTKRAREVFQVEIAALRAVSARIDERFDRAVAVFIEALEQHGKVVVLGVGKSGNIGRKIAATLTSTGTTAVVLDPVDALHGDLGVVRDGDVVLLLSYSGESNELVHLLPAIKRFAVRVVTITGKPDSTLGQHSDVVLDVHVPREACSLNLAPTSSTTATLVMGDALALGIMDARGFREKDFAQLHPAGAIGRSLLLRVARVRDIMREKDRNCVSPAAATVRSVLNQMTAARSGTASIVDKRGRLVGVFTDGDLRRRLPAEPDLLERRMDEVMTRNPVVIRDDALAADALRIFDQRNIDDLIVVDKRNKPVGLVDSQDLPKLKIM
ncbi:MAG TPA: KpsF/GutQ family sugar-phosphate isomerase [Candidatus Limnocylindria bacterium]|nr:KpsF/GutQ family sugar-phosphate isomerase [Candidatus Limnocylindria bacterium]